MFLLSKHHTLTLDSFFSLLEGKIQLGISKEACDDLSKTRAFIDHLLEKNVKAYGITTGFADLRNTAVPSDKAAELSCNIITSHDAGIGENIGAEIVLGAMIVRANSLAKGYSGFQKDSLQTLVDMINARVIPDIPCHGSLGASGDLAPLARLSRAMRGDLVMVSYQGKKMTAQEALFKANIKPFIPLAKEGLAMTNGTSFMASMAAIAIKKQTRLLENTLALLPLFLDAVGAVDAAFLSPIHKVRNQTGQEIVASILQKTLKNSPFIDRLGVQDDYCIRCLPQILGPKIEVFLEHALRVQKELEAVTDNPLIFKGAEADACVSPERICTFNEENWAVLSGGNFHGEYLTTVADSLCALNAKIALLLERQMTYMLNPFRNKQKLPIYLIADSTLAGLSSGYMITQYTGNDIAQKIAAYGVPTGIYNITSANESEDVVSYGSTACQRLLAQISLFEDFLAIYQTIIMQAYAIARTQKNPAACYSEQAFQIMKEQVVTKYPCTQEDSFSVRYEEAKQILAKDSLRNLLGYPLIKLLKQNEPNQNTELSQPKQAEETPLSESPLNKLLSNIN